MFPINIYAVSATWSSTPGTADYSTGTNWVGGVVPGGSVNSTDVATFNSSATKTLTFASDAQIGQWDVNATAYNFNLGASRQAIFYAAGITSNGNAPTVTIGTGSLAQFSNSSTCNGVTFSVSGGTVTFNDTSSAGSSTIINFNTASTLNVNSQIVVGRVTAGGGASGSIINVGSNFTMGDSTNFTYNGTLTGAGTITKTGTGTLTYPNISGSGVNYIISQGSISLGSGGSTGAIQGSIQNDSNLIFNHNATYTHAGLISGSGTVTFSGPANTVLAHANSYSGGSTISQGTVSIGNATALGTGDFTVAGTCTIASSGAIGTVANNFKLGAGFNVTFQGSSSYGISGILSGSSTVTKNGASTLTLSGNNTNTGTITISQGTLQGTTSSLVVDIVNNSALVFNQSFDGTYAKVISGSSTITKSGSGAVTLSANNTFNGTTSINAGTLIITGQIAGNVTVNNNGTLKGTGTANGSVTSFGGTIAPGTSIGTFNIGNALTLDAASTTQIELSPIAASKLVITGTATIDGTLNLIFDSGTYTENTYTILTAGTVTGTYSSITTTGLPANISYALQYPGNSILLNLTVNSSNNSNLSSRATTALGATVGNFLTNVSANNPTTQQSALINAINGISNPTQFNSALEQVQPFSNSTFCSLNLTAKQHAQVSSRLANLRNIDHYIAGDAQYKSSFWLRPFFEGGRQNNYKNLLGYKDVTSGLILGLDRELDNLTLGIGLSYAYSIVKSVNFYNTNTNQKTYLGILYAEYDFSKSVFLDIIMTGGANSYAGTRSIVAGSVYAIANSKYHGQQYSFEAILGKKICYSKLLVTPMVSASYVHLHQNPYSETGAGTLGMSVQSNNTAVGTLGIGAEVSAYHKLSYCNLNPKLHGMIYYDVKSGNLNVNSAFVTGGPALSTNAQPGRFTGVIGASLNYNIRSNLECELVYDLQGKAQYYNNIVYLNFKYLFG